MSQTLAQYDQALDKPQKGQLYDLSPYSTLSFAAEAAIGYGGAVKLGTNKEKQVLPVLAAGETVFGIALFKFTKEQPDSGDAAYEANDTVSVLRSGRVWVETSAAVTAGADAFVVIADGASEGKFTTTDDANTEPVNGTFLTSTTEAGLAVVELNL